MNPENDRMVREAMAQAQRSANRRQEPMCVYVRRVASPQHDVWFVRHESEGVPEGAERFATVQPEAQGGAS